MGNRKPTRDSDEDGSHRDEGSRKPDGIDQYRTITDFEEDQDEESSGIGAVGAAGAASAGSAGALGAAGLAGMVSGQETAEKTDEENEDESDLPDNRIDPGELNHPEEEESEADLDRPSSEKEDHSGEDDLEKSENTNEDNTSGDDENEDTEKETHVVVVQYTDPLCPASWQFEPELLRLQEIYGYEVDFERRIAPPRKIPKHENNIRTWTQLSQEHGMTVNDNLITDTSEDTTKLVNEAVLTVDKIQPELATRFLKRLRTAYAIQGTDITDKNKLLTLADEIGLDPNVMEDNWIQIEKEPLEEKDHVLSIEVQINGIDFEKQGVPDSRELEAIFLAQEIPPIPPRNLVDFVSQWGPITTKEVETVYEWDKSRTNDELSEMVSEGVLRQVEVEGVALWKII